MEHLTEGKTRLTLLERLRRNPTKQNEGLIEDFLKKYATDIKAGKFKTGLELSKQVYEDQGNEYFVVLKYTLGGDDFARKPEDPSMMESTRVQAEKTFERAMSEILEYSNNKGNNPMTERIKEQRISETGLGVGGTPRRGNPKTEEERKEEHIRRYGIEELPPRGSGLDSIDKYAGQPVILINIETGKVIPGGRVVSEEKALATPCHGYDIGEGKKMLWSKGVVGTLSLPEQKKFCKVGMDLKPMTGRLKKRITALREAGIEF